jgi:hypothetical protein
LLQNLPHTGEVLQANATQPSTPTKIQLFPGEFSHVVGFSNSITNFGAYILTPNDGSGQKIFLSGSAATQLIAQLKNQPGVWNQIAGKVAEAVSKLPNNKSFGLVATIDINKVLNGDIAGAFEIGVGGVSTFGDNVAAFYNGRVSPTSGTLSGNIGWLANVGGAAATSATLIGRWMQGLGLSASLASGGTLTPGGGVLAAIGRVLESAGVGSAAFGTATGTKIWYGQAFRGHVTPGNNSGEVEMQFGNGEPLRMDAGAAFQHLIQSTSRLPAIEDYAKSYLAFEKATQLANFVANTLQYWNYGDHVEAERAADFVNQLRSTLAASVPKLVRLGIIESDGKGGYRPTADVREAVNRIKDQHSTYHGTNDVYDREYNLYLRTLVPLLPPKVREEAVNRGLFVEFRNLNQ